MISKDTLDWVQNIGTLIAVLGFLYSSFGIYGASGERAVRPVLPAVLCAGSTLYAVQQLSIIPRVIGGDSWQPSPWILAAMVLTAFVVTYIIAYRRQHRGPARGYGVLINRTYLVSVLATFAVAVAVYAAPQLTQGIPLTWYEALVVATPVSLLVAVYGIAIGSTAILTKDTMLKVGLFLTLIGLLIRFLPPSLDLSRLVK
jgi:hypothetical protein